MCANEHAECHRLSELNECSSWLAIFGGIAQRADVAKRYDPRRPDEALLALRWQAALTQRPAGLRLRRNCPYRGHSDGVAALLCKRFPDAASAGIELEVNQALVAQGGPPWVRLHSDLVDAFAEARTAARMQKRP